MVYVSANNEWDLPNLQYDPVMNGSSTWQIYHGPLYQALVPVPSKKWVKFTLKVQPTHVAVYVGEALEPDFVIPKKMNGQLEDGNIGIWGSSGSYMRNLTVTEIESESFFEEDIHDKQLDDAFVSEWLVCKNPDNNWNKVGVEENGTLNINRLFTCEPSSVVQVKYSFNLSDEKETLLSFGYSDHLRLWVNEVEVYQGDWKWNSPGKSTDGRIRSDHIRIPIRWKSGLNTIRGEVMSKEGMFGWGLCMKIGLEERM